MKKEYLNHLFIYLFILDIIALTIFKIDYINNPTNLNELISNLLETSTFILLGVMNLIYGDKKFKIIGVLCFVVATVPLFIQFV